MPPANLAPKPLLRSAVEPPSPMASTSGIFPKECVLCNKERKNRKGQIEVTGACLTKHAKTKIKEAAQILGDEQLVVKFSDVDFVAKEVRYHHSCRKDFLAATSKAASKSERNERNSMGIDTISSYIEQSVIQNKRPELLTSIYARYVDMCVDVDEKPLQTAQYLMKVIMKKFGERLKAQCPVGKKSGVILYSADMADDAVRVVYDFAATPEGTVTKAALILRQLIKNVPNTEFPDSPTLNDLHSCAAIPPELLSTFFSVLYGGPNPDRHTERVRRCSESTSLDALFVVVRENVKPKKHVALGIAVKSMTGSKQLVTMLNRFGHCLNYSAVEELETAVGYAIHEKEQTCPDGTVPNLPMGVAFDNFDELSNTLSGADTLHDTMGILYQVEGSASCNATPDNPQCATQPSSQPSS